MRDIEPYFVHAVMGVVCAIMIVGCAILSWGVARFMSVTTRVAKGALALLSSPVYAVVCAVAGMVALQIRADTWGFLWLWAMMGFAVLILPAQLFVLLGLRTIWSWRFLVLIALVCGLEVSYMLYLLQCMAA